jgi:predicted nucleic acid-binding protein
VILVDTSVWVDYFRDGNSTLSALLEKSQVISHPWVIGELALGRLDPNGEALGLIADLPAATVATESEVLRLISAEQLAGSGIGYVDTQLVAAARLTWDATVWTRDKRLSAVCDRLGLAYTPPYSKGPDA